MKINRIECDQFAGVQDVDVRFTDGMNLVIGKNESGKSTIADLIFQTLFKDIKLDGRRDSAFIDRYFPKTVSGPRGDVIDGTLLFETEEGAFKLKKEWEKGEGSVRLTTPEKTIVKNQGEISRLLADILEYREGVYDEIVFASQKREQKAIESIMAIFSKKNTSLEDTKNDLSSTLTQAALETGGVSIEMLERKLLEILEEYGSHWDWDSDMPDGGKKRGISNKWSKKVGTILESYYAMEETRQAQQEASNAEKKVESLQNMVRNSREERSRLIEKKAQFQKIQVLLSKDASLRKNLDRQNSEIKEMSDASERWPVLEKNLDKALGLEKAQKESRIREKYLKVWDAKNKYEELKTAKDKAVEIPAEDIDLATKNHKKKLEAESKLAGLNLTARIRQLGELPIEVKTVASESPVDIRKGECNITEAVIISIPGVMEMQLTPQGINVEELKTEIVAANETEKAILKKYKADDIEELRAAHDSFEVLTREVKNAKSTLEIILNGESWESIDADNSRITGTVLSTTEVMDMIRKLCGTKTIDAYIGNAEASIEIYKNKYSSLEKLEANLEEVRKEMIKTSKELDALDDIPKEYRGIDNPENFDQELANSIEKYDDKIDTLSGELNEAFRKLGDRTAEEFSEELLEKENAFKTKKAEYAHWKNIHTVFCHMKEQTVGNPVEDIETKFREYLHIITDGNLELLNMDEKLNTELASGRRKLTYETLSNGTKDTIALAFRLAMLEHLYPEGNGLAVFDDPFTEMDPDRVLQACKLIEKYAVNNQVIFITCDRKYKELLPSQNIIEM